MREWRARRPLLALTGALVLVMGSTALYAWNLHGGPDEGIHIDMVEHHAHELGLVPWTDDLYGQARGHQYHLYSPLPYAPYVPFQYLQEAVGDSLEGPARAERFLVRLGGLAIAAAQLLVTVALVRRLVRGIAPTGAVGVALAVNLLPQLRYLHAYVNTDSLTILAGTVGFVVLLRVLQRRSLDLVDGLVVGVTLGVLGLVRYQGLLVGLVLAVGVAARLIRQPGGLRPRLRVLGVAAAVAVVLAGPFHLHLYHELRNDELAATAQVEEIRYSTAQGAPPARPSLDRMATVRYRALPTTWAGLWAHFPNWLEVTPPLTTLLGIGAAAGLAGVAADRGRTLTSSGRRTIAAAVVATVATLVAIAVQWPVPQTGRFLLPAGVTVLAGVVVGTASLVARRTVPGRAVALAAAGWGGLLLTLNAWALTVLVGR